MPVTDPTPPTSAPSTYYADKLGEPKDPTKIERGDAVTPVGLHHVIRERPDGWWEGDLGEIYRPKYFVGGIAIHGSNSIPNYPASHGCVRVSVPAMDWIWEFGLVPIETPVWVHGAVPVIWSVCIGSLDSDAADRAERSEASAVLIGTDATSPVDPTSARTTSTVTISRVITDVTFSPATLNSNIYGSAAPAYARNRVLTVEGAPGVDPRRPVHRSERFVLSVPCSGRSKGRCHGRWPG